jgi:hypothetical protein
VAQGAQFRPGPWLAPKAGREPWNRVQTLVDREYEARSRPRVQSRGDGRARARPNTLARGYAQAYPMGMALEPPGDVGRVGRGSLGQEPLILRLNIPLCLDLVTWESTSWCTNHSRMNHSHLPSASSLDYVCH